MAFVALVAFARAASATETSTPYEVRVDWGAQQREMEALQPLLERALRSFRLQERGAPSPALLRRRADSDLETIGKILRAEGRYEPQLSVAIAGDPGKPPLQVTFKVDAGPLFRLAAHRIEYRLGDGASDKTMSFVDAAQGRAFGSPVGGAARASEILAAEAGAVEKLSRSGRPFARLLERRVRSDRKRKEIRVVSVVEAGPFAAYGPLSVHGAEGVDRDFIESYKTWTEGEPFDDAALAKFERALASTGLFEVAAVARPEIASMRQGGATPIALQLREAAARSVGLGARYSTDGGAEGRVAFEHRNLFGGAERLKLALEGGGEDQAASVSLRKPQFRRPGQDLVVSLNARREQSDAYDEMAVDLGFGVERNIDIGPWTGARAGIGALFEASVIEDASIADGGSADDTAYLVGVPAFLRVDARNDPLNPSGGHRLNFSATPFFGQFDDSATSFLVLDAQGSVYLALDDAARLVLAGRGRLGGVLSDDLAGVPSPRRLYSGGGGSVRGYAQRFVGPLDASGDPIGGRAVVEIGGELRWRPLENFGLTTFLEAGGVSTEFGVPSGDDWRIGAGPGLRYFSPIGPIGVDVGLPIDPRPQDAPYQLYFFIGQAF